MEQVRIMGIGVHKVTRDSAASLVDAFMDERKPHLVVTANTEIVMRALHDALYAQILARADLVVPDGIGLVWASRVYGLPLPMRVPGIDLMQLLLQEGAKKNRKVYLLGASKGVAKKVAQWIHKQYPGIHVVGVHDGFFSAKEEEALLQEIIQAKPDLLFVALGVPRQEKWLAAHLARLQVPVAMGVGGSFDVLAGITRRAPLLMQRLGLEWLYRLLKNPKRLLRMMVIPRFMVMVMGERLRGKRWKDEEGP